jgi:hypothetical protein
MLTRTLLTKLTLLLWLSLLTASARAAPQSDQEQVETAIQAGIELRKAGNDAAALELFIKLERENPGSVRLMLQVTAAAQATGRWLVAHEYLRKAAAYKNDIYYQRNRAAVKSVEEAVAQHVGQFRVIGEPSGAEVRLSGNRVGTLPMAEPVPVELGSYTLEVSKPGYYQLRRDLTVGAGGALNQEVVELKPSPAPTAPSSRVWTSAGPVASSESPPADRGWWRSRSLTWLLGGMTVAAAATSGGALLVRERAVERWNDDTQCLDLQKPDRTREEVCSADRSTAESAERVALGAGVAAGVLATATLAQLILSAEAPARKAEARRSTSCGVGFASFTCSGTF